MNLLSGLLLIVLAALPAFVALALLGRRNAFSTGIGVALVVAAGLIPLALAYGFAFGLGLIGVVLGGAGAAIWRGRAASRRMRLGLAGAVLWLALEPVLVLNVWQVQADESYDRCAADRAIAIADASAASGQGYPASIHDISVQDSGYGRGTCYVSGGVNWLYRVESRQEYTLGYWVDWRVVRHVCLHRNRTGGWSCGLETWEPFRPGETD